MRKKIFFILLSIIYLTECATAQFRLSGIVKDQNKKPVPGVVIRIQNSQFAGNSAADGTFIINSINAGSYTLDFFAMGFESKSIPIHLKADMELAVELKTKPYLSEEITISATRTGKNAGMSVSTYSREEIETMNTGQDLPYVLQLLPSVLVTSDAGNGIGYTGVRIRGSDAARVNVTINGIPINDAESQLVYWVNMPDFASSAESIEVTRGAGTSTNGAGAFGGTINIQSQSQSDSAFLQSSNAFGSFNTLKNNISFGTGLLKNNFSFEGRLSSIVSDGYIDRATSNLKSLYLSGVWKNKNNILRFNCFTGKEKTYQSWYGVPESRIEGNQQDMLDYSIRNYLSESETENLLNSGRNYNYYSYDDQTDNYRQDHYQFLFSHVFDDQWLLNIALHATKGKGYYEEYKNNEQLSEYGLADIEIGDTTITSSNLIRRRWLDNWFYGSTWTYKGNIYENVSLIFGGGINRYDGDHYGEIIWAEYSLNSPIRQRYYENNAVKDDYNTYLKSTWDVSNTMNVFFDLQYRGVSYSFTGPGEDGLSKPQNTSLYFFNPKMGITFRPDFNLTLYGSVSVANKEPNRDDYVESTPLSRPKPERMNDFEAGIIWNNKKIRSSLNFYFMDYFDQLVLTGKVNDVGSYTRTNISRSYRTGIEAEIAIQPLKKLLFQGNLTVSDNRLKQFTAFTDMYDADFNLIGQESKTYNNTTIAFSPAVTTNCQLQYSPIASTSASFIIRHVSEQYLDNTENKQSTLPAYTVGDLRLSYTPKVKFCNKLRFDFLINNIFSTLYESNGYTYEYIYDNSKTKENYYYPQAGINFVGQITLLFK